MSEKVTDLEVLIEKVKEARKSKKYTEKIIKKKWNFYCISFGYLGNVVDLWERFVKEEEMLVDLGSD